MMASVKVETVYGKDGAYPDPYLTRVSLPFGLALHVFHRADNDPDPHDHKRPFVTLPFVSYVEHVYDPRSGREWWRVVKAWRPHFRPARYAHRILGVWDGAGCVSFPLDPLPGQAGRPVPGWGDGGIATLVLWLGRARSTWGFWVRDDDRTGGRGRVFVEWRPYIFGGRADG